MIKIVDGGVQYPVVVLVLLHIPLAAAIPVLVGERFLLSSRQTRPQREVRLSVNTVSHLSRGLKDSLACHSQSALEGGVAMAIDQANSGFAWAARAKDDAARTGVVGTIEHNRAGASSIENCLVVGTSRQSDLGHGIWRLGLVGSSKCDRRRAGVPRPVVGHGD